MPLFNISVCIPFYSDRSYLEYFVSFFILRCHQKHPCYPLVIRHYSRGSCFGCFVSSFLFTGVTENTRATRCLYDIIPAGLLWVFRFLGRQSTYRQHAPNPVHFLRRGLHIPGRSLTRSTFACRQQGSEACRPASPKTPEQPAVYTTLFPRVCFGCFVSA